MPLNMYNAMQSRHLLDLVLVVLLAGPCLGQASNPTAGEDWGTAWFPDWQLSLRVPPDWRLDCPLLASEARLVSPQGTEIAVRLWIGAVEATAEEAAEEYQQTLSAQVRGARPSEQALVSAGGLRGVWFTVEGDAGDRPLLAYVVYAAGMKRIALAVRGIKGHEEAARQRLAATAASLRLGVLSPPVSAPSPEAALPPGITPPATPALPPPAPPVAVPVAPSAPLPATNRVVMAGFLLTVPEGWRATLERGTVWVEKPEQPVGYFLWPARAGEEETSLGDLPARWAAEAGLELDLRSPAVRQGNTLFALGNLIRGLPVAVALYAWTGKEAALVAGVYAPPADWDQAHQTAKWLGETRTLGWRPAQPPLWRARRPGWTPAARSPFVCPRTGKPKGRCANTTGGR